MTTTDGNTVQVRPAFQNLVLGQHLVLPLGVVSELLQQIGERQVYLLISGIRGSREGITLETYLRTTQTSIFLAAEGLYGLKNASREGKGMTASQDITLALDELRYMSLKPQTPCALLLQPRFPLNGDEMLHIEQVAMYVSAD